MSLDTAIQHLLAAKRISNVSQSYAKDNPGEWVKVKTYLSGGARPTGVVTEMGVGLMEVEDVRRGSAPPPGTALDTFADFANNNGADFFLKRWKVPPALNWTSKQYVGDPWPDGSGIWEIATTHGPGFRFVHNETTPHGSGGGVQIRDENHLVPTQNWLGTVFDVQGKILFPRNGNPNGFAPYGDWNALWEFGDREVWNQFGIDGRIAAEPKIYVRTFNSATNWTRKFLGPTIPYDRWVNWRWQIRWDTGATGYMNFWWDGQHMAQHSGATQKPGDFIAPWLQWGWYGGNDGDRNEIQYAALREL